MKVNEWIASGENSKIILTDKVANVNRLCRKYNREMGKDVKNVKGLTLGQIAWELLCGYMAYTGEYNNLKVINGKTCIYVMDKLLKKNKPSFIPKESMCVKTSKEVLKSLNQIRRNTLKVEIEENVENDKLKQLVELIGLYEDELCALNLVDDELLLKKVCSILDEMNSEEAGNKENLAYILPWVSECSFAKLSDYEMTGLEMKFVEKLKAVADKEVEELEFYGEIKADVKFKFFKAYGMANEVKYIVDCIEKETLQYGEVNVLYGTAEYENYIRSEFESKGIPYRFVTGSSIEKTDVIQFVLSILDWAEDDYLYEKLAFVVDNIQITFNNNKKGEEKVKRPSHYYNKYLNKGIGWGRQRYIDCVNRVKEDEEEALKYEAFNEFLLDITGVFEDIKDCGKMYGRIVDLCGKYIRRSENTNKLVAILKEQKDALAQVERFDETDSESAIQYIREYIKDIELGEEGETKAVSVMRIGNLEVLERTNNFVIGLSAKQFAADTKESAVLSDKELEKYIEGKVEYAKEVAVNVRQRLLASFATLSKGSIIMGYSMFDTVELKENSPSIFYLEHFEKYGEGKEEIKHYDVIKSPIKCWGNGLDSRINNDMQDVKKADEYVGKDNEIENTDEAEVRDGNTNEDTTSMSTGIRISSSGLQTLLACPLRYYYKYVNGLAERNQLKKDNSRWLDGKSKGNLFHHTMEEYCNTVIKHNEINVDSPDEAEFDRIYLETINKILEEVPYISKTIFEKERDENKKVIKRFLESFYDEMYKDFCGDKKWRILGCEVAFENVNYVLKSQVPGHSDIVLNFHGFIDRLDGYVDKNGILHLRVIDYKTGEKKTIEEDVVSDKQIQHFVYVLALKEYFEKNKDNLEKIFCGKIASYCVDDVSYIFPYEYTNSAKFSMIDIVNGCLSNGEYRLPQKVNNAVWKVLDNVTDRKKKSELADMMCREDKWEVKCKYCNYVRQCRCKMGNEF